MKPTKNQNNRYQLETRSNLKYVRFALVLFIGTFILASITNQEAFKKCMEIYSNPDICYKLNYFFPACYLPRPPNCGLFYCSLLQLRFVINIFYYGAGFRNFKKIFFLPLNLLINHDISYKILHYNNTTILH